MDTAGVHGAPFWVGSHALGQFVWSAEPGATCGLCDFGEIDIQLRRWLGGVAGSFKGDS